MLKLDREPWDLTAISGLTAYSVIEFMDLSSDRWLGGVSPRKGEVHSPDPGSEHGPGN